MSTKRKNKLSETGLIVKFALVDKDNTKCTCKWNFNSPWVEYNGPTIKLNPISADLSIKPLDIDIDNVDINNTDELDHLALIYIEKYMKSHGYNIALSNSIDKLDIDSVFYEGHGGINSKIYTAIAMDSDLYKAVNNIHDFDDFGDVSLTSMMHNNNLIQVSLDGSVHNTFFDSELENLIQKYIK